MRIGAAAPAVATVDQGVSIDGTYRGARRIRLSRSMGGAPLLGHSGQMGATGEITAVSAQDGPEPSIWRRQYDNWPPKPGDSARASIGTHEAGRWGVLQGLIRSANRVGPHMWSLVVADEMAPLRTTVSMDPLTAFMPPPAPGGDRVAPGLTADYVAHRAFRACGINNTPPVPPGFIGVSAPMQDSMWPEVGDLREASQSTNTSFSPNFDTSAGVHHLSDGRGVYRSSRDGDNLRIDGSFIAVTVPTTSTGLVSINLRNNAGTIVGQLVIGAGRSIAARFGIAGDLVELTMPASQSWTRVVVAARGGTLTLSRNDGSPDRTSAFMAGNTWRDLDVNVAGGAGIAGLMAGNTLVDTPARYLGHSPNLAMHRPATLTTSMLTLHRIRPVCALDLIQEIAQATLRACWRDEDGVVQWMPWCVAISQPAVTDVTSDAHALDGWGESESLDDKHRRVAVTTKWPETLSSRYPEQVVFQGRGETIEKQGEQRSEVMACPDDETWIGVDFPPVQMAQEGYSEGWRNFTIGRGSARGGVLVGPGDRTRWGYPNAIDVTAISTGAVPVGPDAWRLMTRYESHASLPNDYTVSARTPNDEAVHTTLPRWQRDHPLPVYRAYVKATWVDAQASAGSGPPLAGDYDHDGGRWVQQYDGLGPQLFADWLAQHVLDPLGTIDLPVHHDPRLQVGDVVNYVDAHRHGITLRALIVGIDQESWIEEGQAGQDMTLRLLVLAVVKANVTYDDARRASPGTYTDDQSRHAGRTYTEVTAALTGGS